MIPNITIGSREISAYLLAALIGIFAAGLFVLKMIDKNRRDQLLVILLWSSLGVLAGGHIVYGITNIPNIIAAIKAGAGLFTILSFFGGSVFYGGLLGGLAAAVIYCRIVHVDVSEYADYGAMFIPCFHVFGRIGCFLAGFCYGRETDAWYGMEFNHSVYHNMIGVKVIPTQLIMSAANFVHFFLLAWIATKAYKAGKDGVVAGCYLLFYSIGRFLIEFLRNDPRGGVGGLSTSQFISLFIFAAGVGMVLFFGLRKGQKNLILEEKTE